VKYGYYPGCTLKKNAAAFEETALRLCEALDLAVEEMEVWNCCGTSFGLSRDLLIHQVAPLRNILRAREQGFDAIVTLCSICYNTLKRADAYLVEDPVVRRRLTSFLDDYGPYEGGFPVYHLLEVLEDRVGLAALTERVSRPLAGLKAAPYYGCMLVRPASLGFDALEQPGRLSRFLGSLGAEAVDFPLRTECCGSYHAVAEQETSDEFSARIIENARSRGAEVLVTSCPLCHHNLDRSQERLRQSRPGFAAMPVVYFTQAAAYALGAPPGELGFAEHAVDPTGIIERLAETQPQEA